MARSPTELTPEKSAEAPGARSGAIDVLRVVALVAIVAGHVGASNQSVRALTYPWHVPLFFVLTGYLWRPERKLVAEVRNRARTLLRPYVSWLIVVGCIYFGLEGCSAPTLGDLLLGGKYIGVPFSAFWFVTALFAAAVVYRAIGPDTRNARLGVAALALTGATLFGRTLGTVPESLGVAMGSLFFLAVGDLYREWRGRWPIAVGLLLIPCGLAIAAGWSAPLDLKRGDFGTPVASALVAVAICASALAVAERIVPALPGWVTAWCTAVASVGMVLVLTHAVALLAGWPAPVTFVVALAVPVTLGLLLQRTFLSGWLTGR